MAQQINLCTPILLTPKRYFSATTLAASLGVFVVLGGALCGAWVWNLGMTTRAFQDAMAAQSRDLQNLKIAIVQAKAKAEPADPALTNQLKEMKLLMAQREQLRDALKEGLFEPGWGHSDRLALISRTIPSKAWTTDIKIESGRFEVSGFTLDTAELNRWVDRLAIEPLTQGLKLSTVKVESVPWPASLQPTDSAAGAATVASAASAPSTPLWSYQLVSHARAQPASTGAVRSAP